MKITEVETVLLDEFPNLVYVRVHTDEGIVGLGETFFTAEAVASWMHSMAAPYLLGKDPLRIEQHWLGLNGFIGFNSTGVEMRARSAIDIALWDILGQVCRQPIHQLLGGAVRDRVPIYNTCADSNYVRKSLDRYIEKNPVRASASASKAAGTYEDLQAFTTRADELAQSLLGEGIRGMKIWPFDPFAEKSGGHSISARDLSTALKPFEKIRGAVGDQMDIMVELHSMWDLPTAIKIAQALEPLKPAWFEDPIKMDDLGALAKFAGSTRVPTAASETLATRWSFRDLLERRAAGMVIFDPTWAGGISEGKKIASMAEAYQLPATPHDCVGPVSFAVALHLSVNAPNTPVQEFVRAFYSNWYKELVTELPKVSDGYAYPLTGPGLGTQLLKERLSRPDVHQRSSKLATVGRAKAPRNHARKS
ncbi:MAG: mandelate racemase/muconate lactonizing enzyme family protein [Verrucomicrobia bacterium]|nr:mandelate racemase/muconate lactonizing enzyme family protein [Verrucomicrobiota bacterium]